MHAWDDDTTSTFDQSVADVLILLPVSQHLEPGQYRDLANGLYFLAKHFEQAGQMPSLQPENMRRLRELHLRGNG